MSGTTLTDLLEALGHEPGEHIAVCHQRPGGAFNARILPVEQAQQCVDSVSDGTDVWYSVNPVQAGAAGRGTAAQVTRLAALYADLDAKTGGMPDLTAAQAVVDTLTQLLEAQPTAVTFSGHGLQPYWALDPGDPATHLDTDQKRTDAQALLRRFGRLVANVAERHGGQVDSIFDLARVLRAPATANHKEPDAPVPVVTALLGGPPLTTDRVLETLDAYGIPHLAGDDDTLGGQVVSDPATWAWTTTTCGYAATMAAGWAGDTPPARHSWLVAQATRLAAAHRHGCLTAAGHRQAVAALDRRFRQLLAGGQVRDPSPGEIADAHTWARARAATMGDDQLRRELGGHIHLVSTSQPTTTKERHLAVVPPTDGSTALAVQPAEADDYGPTEDGAARQFADESGHVVRFCPQRRSWLTWDGHRWRWDEAGATQEAVREMARRLPEGEGWRNHKSRCLSSRGVTGILSLAQTDERIVTHLEQLDARPYELNTPSGIVDMTTGALRPADPAALHTRSTTIAPDFDRRGEVFDRFLADTFGEDAELRTFVQRLLGLSAIGTVLEQVLPFAHGTGANGKSTLLEAVMAVLGRGLDGYSTAAPAEMLMVRRHAEHPAEIAQLSGARLVVCSELDDGQKFAEARLKQLTGRDSVNARFMRGNPFTFTPTHTMWLIGNHQPQAQAGGPAFWRRVKLLSFSRVVPEEQRDPRLGERLLEEGPAVLAWLIRGAADYAEHGLGEPASVRKATEGYAADQDTVGRFVADSCFLSPAAHTPMRAVRDAYEKWCDTESETPVSGKRLGQELRSRFGISDARTTREKRYVGLALLTDEAAQDDDRNGHGELYR